jgi:hypothetical protein
MPKHAAREESVISVERFVHEYWVTHVGFIEGLTSNILGVFYIILHFATGAS